MITFLDGPAEGVTLQLRRAPLLLRVVQSQAGAWDALDQLVDEPKARETICVYYRASGIRSYFSCSRSHRSQSGLFLTADYRHFEHQPADDVMRDTAAWQRWAAENAATIEWRLKSKPAEPAEAM
jgi:hypothetical protein